MEIGVIAFAGYSPLFHYLITCTEDGVWNPRPFCLKVYEGFVIFQKLRHQFACLTTTWAASAVDESWLLTYTSSLQSCISRNNTVL